jgi:hypothetical protein
MGDVRAKCGFIAAFAKPPQANFFELVFGDHAFLIYTDAALPEKVRTSASKVRTSRSKVRTSGVFNKIF